MKGDCTVLELVDADLTAADHPQMKGDCTTEFGWFVIVAGRGSRPKMQVIATVRLTIARLAFVSDILFLKTTIRAINNGRGVQRPGKTRIRPDGRAGRPRRRGGKERKKQIRVLSTASY